MSLYLFFLHFACLAMLSFDTLSWGGGGVFLKSAVSESGALSWAMLFLILGFCRFHRLFFADTLGYAVSVIVVDLER